MRRIAWAFAVLAVGACSVGRTSVEPSGPSLRQRATDFAATADRALAGTRFEEVTTAALADALEGICSGSGGFDQAVLAAVATLPGAPGDLSDDDVAAEVLIAGVVEVCPERVGAVEVMSTYLESVLLAAGEVDVDPHAVLAAGPVVCRALDESGEPERALLGAAEALFGIVAPTFDDLTGLGMTPDQAVVTGATLAAAVEHLCPEHREAVIAFIDGLG